MIGVYVEDEVGVEAELGRSVMVCVVGILNAVLVKNFINRGVVYNVKAVVFLQVFVGAVALCLLWVV